MACGFAGTGCVAHAAATIAQLDSHAHAATLALVAVAFLRDILRGEQVHLVVCFEAGGASSLDAAALHCEVAVLACTGGLDGDVAACCKVAAPSAVGTAVLFEFATARTQADADTNASDLVCGVVMMSSPLRERQTDEFQALGYRGKHIR